MVKLSGVKRVLVQIILVAAILGSMAGFWFTNKIGPWRDWKDTWSPYLSWTDDPSTTMTISFKTPQNVSTIVQYGISRSYNASTTTTDTQWHSVTLTSLQPSTTYYYRISSSTYNYTYMNNDYSFTTAPAQSNPSSFRFAVYGDHRQTVFGRGFHPEVVDALIRYHPEFVIDVGDVVLDASGNDNGQWDRLFYEWRHLTPYTPIMIGLGNHEFYEGSNPDFGAYYTQVFNFPGAEHYYSFNYSNAHFISLNLSCDEHRVLPSSPEYTWLLDDLQKANSSPEIDWIFVFFHVPLYSSGTHGSNANLINDLQHIFDSSSVDLVLQGHDHHYERMKIANLTYLLIGGGGAEHELCIGTQPWSIHTEIGASFGLFDIDGKTLTMEAIRVDGYVFDRLKIIKS